MCLLGLGQFNVHAGIFHLCSFSGDPPCCLAIGPLYESEIDSPVVGEPTELGATNLSPAGGLLGDRVVIFGMPTNYKLYRQTRYGWVGGI